MHERDFPFLPEQVEEPNRGVYTEADYQREISWLIDEYLRGKMGLDWLKVRKDALRAKVGLPIPLRWEALRTLVWERDNGICQVCLEKILWEDYECGHIIDRCVGGPDHLSNLVVMCVLCNRMKPVHETREDYATWVRSGGFRAELESIITRSFYG